MTVTLTNRSGRLKTFVLPHESYCAARDRCTCTARPGRGTRRLAPSLTLAAGVGLEVDEAVLAIPDIARAVRAGELRVEREPPPATRVASPDTNNHRAEKKSRGDR